MIQRCGFRNIVKNRFKKGGELMNVTPSRFICCQNWTGDTRTASLTTTGAPPPIKGSSACSIEGSNTDEIRSAARKRASTLKSRLRASILLDKLACSTTTALALPWSPMCRSHRRDGVGRGRTLARSRDVARSRDHRHRGGQCARCRGTGQPVHQHGLGHQHRHAGIGQHEVQSFGRIAGSSGT